MPEFEHKRAHRVAQLVQQELGRLLVEGVKDPRVGFVTVTEVRLTDDLRSACAYVSVFGTDDERRNSLTGLRKAAGYLKRELGRRLKLRFTPELTFAHDTTLDNAQRLQTLLNAAARGDIETPAPDAEAPLPHVQTAREMPPAPTFQPAPRPRAARADKASRTRRRRLHKSSSK